MQVIEILFWLSLGLLYYIYDGYLRLLQIVKYIVKTPNQSNIQPQFVNVTVLVTVHDEARQIRDRIHNILTMDYPAACIEVLVASDGSTDQTDEIVRTYGDSRVRLFRPTIRGGKTATQNEAIRLAAGDIVVFTDADTRFDDQFLKEMSAAFRDPTVGAADGHLLFVKESGNTLSSSQGFYWNYELKLRQLESALGILAVASGACLAVRKDRFVEMDPSIGEDCIVPLDIVCLGEKVVHMANARAYDRMDNSAEKEFRTRIRMTSRNWRGTWMRSMLLNPFKFPGYALALWSHKILRWLSPFLLIFALGAGLILGMAGGGVSWSYIVLPGGLVMSGLVAWLAGKIGVHIPGLGIAYSFCLANLGFFLGVIKAILGKPVVMYK